MSFPNIFLFRDGGRGCISRTESGKIILPDRFSHIQPKSGEYWEVELTEKDRFYIAKPIRKIVETIEYSLTDDNKYIIRKRVFGNEIGEENLYYKSDIEKYTDIPKELLLKRQQAWEKVKEREDKISEMNKKLRELASKLFGQEEKKIENEKKIELQKIPQIETEKIESGEYYYTNTFFEGSGIMTDKKSVRRGSWMFSEHFNKKSYYGKTLYSNLEEHTLYQAELTKYTIFTNNFSVEKTALKIIGYEKESEERLIEEMKKELQKKIKSHFFQKKHTEGVLSSEYPTETIHDPSMKLINFFTTQHNIELWWEEGWFGWSDDDEKEIEKVIGGE